MKWREESNMRPLKLVMNAFGPYKEKVVIDFTQFHQQTLFLVSGPTGAGKTTIFDAIAYALYDDASGTSRGKDSFKSQFATDEVLCFVELEFEIMGRKYFIKRSPAQKGPGKNGKLKNWSSEVEFHHDGTVTTKINEANKEIQELLSLSYEQFKQIVMLPQGEFKKMLESNSADKEKIFRNIFQTDRIKEFQSILKEKASDLKQEINQSESTLQQFVGMIPEHTNDILNEAIAYFDIPMIIKELGHVVESYQKKIAVIEKKLATLDGKYHSNQRKIELLTVLDSLEKEKNFLDNSKEMIETKRVNLELAKKAEDCLEVKRQLERIVTEKETIEKEQYDEQQKLAETVGQLDETEKNYAVFQLAYSELPNKREALIHLKEQEKLLGERVAKYDMQANLKKENEQHLQNIQLLKSQVEIVEEQLKKQELELKEIQQAKISMLEKQREANSLQQKQYETIKQQESLNELSVFLEKQAVKASEFKEIENQFTQIERQYQEQRLVYNRNIAGVLANDLEENKACPVCGSLHHPAPAMVAPDTISKEMLEELEIQKNEAGMKFDRISIELQGLNKSIHSSETNLAIQKSDIQDERNKIERQVTNENKQQQQLTAELADLQNRVNTEEEIEKNKQGKVLQIKEKETTIQKLHSSVQYNKKRIDELTIEIDFLNTTVIETDLSVLHKQVEEKTNEITYIENDYIEAQEKKVQLEKMLTQYQTSTKSLEKQVQTLLERESEMREKFKQQLALNHLEDTFENYLLSQETKQQWGAEIESFDKKKWTNQTNILEQKRLLEKESTTHSCEVYTLDNQEIERESKMLKEQQHEQIGTNKTIQSILSQIQLNHHAKKDQQEEYLMYKELAEMANGSKETDYISFERYVLGIYFEEIIEAANTRFTQMTTNRYSLIRNKEKTKGAGPKGLDLDVFDNYTGMKRSVKTLSGGESFKASLALALGLSDVIQNHSGGVSVDTLFIDEGFGTLDVDSLDSAIETLFELNQRGRLVGIISHVEELKTRIPVHIEVTKSSRGSHATIKT